MSRLNRRRIAQQFVVAVGTLVLASGAVGLLQDGLGVPNPSAVYLVAVVATAFVAGAIGASLVAIASFVLDDFLFVEPRYTFTISQPSEWVAVLLLLFVGIVVGQLVALQKSRTELAREREREARALFRVSRALATRESTPAALVEIIRVVTDEARMREAWIALGSSDATERVAAGARESIRPGTPTRFRVLRRMAGDVPAQWVLIHQPAVAARTAHAPGAVAEADPKRETYRVRIEASGTPLGSIWARRDNAAGFPDRSETRLLSSAADQIGQALGHDRVVAERQAAELARQSDRVKSALLQSVSHDLRTPLATIRAAAGGLRPGSGLTASEQLESAEAIDREVEYLNRLVTNLLDLSRIEAGALRADREVFELDDLVERSIDRLRPRLTGHPLELALSDLPVEVDPVLLDEALTNIVENAIRYTPASAPLRIAASRLDHRVRLTIEDGGPGVPDDSLPRLFDKFYRAPGERRGSRPGTGIGLAVVRGLLEAMGGTVVARRSDLGGLAIDLDLPLGPPERTSTGAGEGSPAP